MPALKSTLRLIVLGACADVATAFGTLRKGDDMLVNVETENAGSTAPACPCDLDWYCHNGDYPMSLMQPALNSYDLTVLTQSVNYCWNMCFKDPSNLNAASWAGENCAACADAAVKGDYGCKCGTKAEYFDACQGEVNADGDSRVDVWYNEICTPAFHPGGALFNNLISSTGTDYNNYQKILGDTRVNGVSVNNNPFNLKSEYYGATPICATRGSEQSVQFATEDEACGGILDGCTSAGCPSKDVGSAAGCSSESTGSFSPNNCGSLYYYGDSWVYYCKPATSTAPTEHNNAGFNAFCRTFDGDEAGCGTAASPKHISLAADGNWNFCGYWNGKCKEKDGWSTVKPASGACEAPPQDDEANAFRFPPSTCKQALCGNRVVEGEDPNNAACA